MSKHNLNKKKGLDSLKAQITSDSSEITLQAMETYHLRYKLNFLCFNKEFCITVNRKYLRLFSTTADTLQKVIDSQS